MSSLDQFLSSIEETQAALTPQEIADSLTAKGIRLLAADGRLFVDHSDRLTAREILSIREARADLFGLAAPWPADVAVPTVTASPAPNGPTRLPDTVFKASRPSVSLVGADLSSYLSNTPETQPDWHAQPPPSLDGINDIILNFETTGLKYWAGDAPIGVTVGTLDGKLKRYLPFAHRGGDSGGNLDPVAIKDWLKREVRGKNITNAHTSFDVHMGLVMGVDFEAQGCTVSDVQHYAALLDDHRKRFALDVLAKDYLGGIEVPRIDERNMAEYAPYEVAPRAEYQVALVAQLREAMWPELDKQDLQRVRQLEDEVIYPVVEMENNGAPIDMELLEAFSKECEKTHNDLLWQVSKEVGFNFDHTPTSWQKLFNYYNLPLTYLDEENKKATFAEGIVGKIDHSVVRAAHMAGQLASLNSKIFAAYKSNVGPDGILRFDINQLKGDDGGTVSGRFSIGYVQQVPNHDNHHATFSEGPTDSCDHAVCHLFPRRLYVPKDGQWLESDAEQIEYRIFASFANNKKVIAAYKENPKTSFHKLLWGMIKAYKPDMLYSHQKSLNFLKMYAGGLVKIGVQLGFITEAEGEDIRKRRGAQRTDPRLAVAREIEAIYAKEMPEVDPLQKHAMHLAKSSCDKDCRDDAFHAKKIEHRGYVCTLLGRRSRFPNNWKTYRALNRIVSGSAADVNKQKIVELHRERKHTGLRMRLTVHDAVAGDALFPETAARVTEILNRQSFPQLKVPILWSTKTGPNWAACK